MRPAAGRAQPLRLISPASRLAPLPVRDFPEPASPVAYETWSRGPYVLTYDPTPPPPPTETETETEK